LWNYAAARVARMTELGGIRVLVTAAGMDLVGHIVVLLRSRTSSNFELSHASRATRIERDAS
jgi:hypothetical protein